jgi:hypothetical protein
MGPDLLDYLATLPARRREESDVLIALYRRATGEVPVLYHPGIVGFGRYTYRYRTGRTGAVAAAGFAPRSREIYVYLADGVGRHADLLAALGPHRAGVGCIYLRRVEDVDTAVLEKLVRRSFRALTEGLYEPRASDEDTAGTD